MDTAEHYTYVREHGQNKGREVAVFLKSVGINYPAPWCAAFVNYTLQANKMPHKMTGMASTCCPNKEELIYNKGKIAMRNLPQAGDLFFWFRPGGGHTGIIKDWPKNGDYFTTIEGNVSTPDGGQGVAVKTRLKANVQKVYAASMLPSFSSSEEVGVQDHIVDTNKMVTQTEIITTPEPATQTPKTPPYAIGIFALVVLVLWQKGYIAL